MDTNTRTRLVIILIALGGLTVLFLKNSSPDPQPVADQHTVYCSADGTLADTMPIQSHRSYCIKSHVAGKTVAPGTPSEYAFSIIDDQGNTLKDFAILHTRPMHVILVRKDLSSFQHLHPEFDEQTGVFTVRDMVFPDSGPYRVFADFAPANGQKDEEGTPLGVTLSQDVTVDGVYTPQPIGDEGKAKIFGGYQVSLATRGALKSGSEQMLMFTIKQDGKLVTDLEEYLGALGHSVILKEGTLDFIHVHPMEVTQQNGVVSFMVALPSQGKYKVFTQFQHDGNVFTTDFVVNVAEGSSPVVNEHLSH